MLTNQRSKFSLNTKTTFINAAYMSPLLKSVEKIGIQGILKKQNPADISAIDFFETGEEIRKEFAKLIRAKESNRIVIIPSASYGLASVVKNIRLKPSQNIIMAEGQFPSNYYPWQRLANDTGAKLKIVSAPKDLTRRGKKWNEKILESINRNTRIVALGHIHWTDGTIWNLKKIRQRTREVGAL
jgi:selenocysteine lyase/cysteine desulfurase